jgi:hypothetical protein
MNDNETSFDSFFLQQFMEPEGSIPNLKPGGGGRERERERTTVDIQRLDQATQ